MRLSRRSLDEPMNKFKRSLTGSQRRMYSGSAIAEFAPTLMVLFFITFPLLNLLGVGCGYGAAVLAAWQGARQASTANTHDEALDVMAKESLKMINSPIGKFAKLEPIGGYSGCGCSLFIKSTNLYGTSTEDHGANVGVPIADSQLIYECETRGKFNVGPLIPMRFIPGLADVPGLGIPFRTQVNWHRAVEHRSMLSDGPGVLYSDANHGQPPPKVEPDVAEDTNRGWLHKDLYDRVKGAGQQVAMQDVVRVNADQSKWSKVGMSIQQGQHLWIDTRRDDRWSYATDDITADGSASNVSDTNGFKLGSLIGKIGAATFFIGRDQLGTPAPASGDLYLLMNDVSVMSNGDVQNPTEWSNNKGTMAARILVAQ